METPSSPSVASLRHRSERSRAELKNTIGDLSQALTDTTDELKTTLSSHNLKQEVRAYAREKQAKVIQAMQRNVTNHPLEALAIGALATYPFLGLLRKVPVPLALIGAGLLFARNRKESTEEMRARWTGRPGDTDEITDAEGLGERLRSGLAETQDSVASAGAKARETIADMATSAVSGIQSTAQDLTAQTGKAGGHSRDAILNLVHRNPLMAGGLAMAIGGFIAASIPAFRVEERVLGKGSEVVKDTVRKAADGVVRGAKAEAAKVAENISAAARETGLTPGALDQTVDAVTDKVAAVVDRGVNAAVSAESARQQTEDSSDGDGNAKL
jgi:hypothetical protein